VSLDQGLLDILACPVCKSPVCEQDEKVICENGACGLRYPIRNGIPVMLAEEAKKSL
jgi:uncharacterized protein